MKGIDTVAVLDFGSPSARLLARKIREARVFSEILPFDTPPEKLKALAPCGLVLAGGPEGTDHGAAPVSPGIFQLGILVLRSVTDATCRSSAGRCGRQPLRSTGGPL